ncbi:hypothetical protein GCM10009647_071700 [Streptomyces sanglieri]
MRAAAVTVSSAGSSREATAPVEERSGVVRAERFMTYLCPSGKVACGASGPCPSHPGGAYPRQGTNGSVTRAVQTLFALPGPGR